MSFHILVNCIECLVPKFCPRVDTVHLAFNPVSIQYITKLCTLNTYVSWGGADKAVGHTDNYGQYNQSDEFLYMDDLARSDVAQSAAGSRDTIVGRARRR